MAARDAISLCRFRQTLNLPVTLSPWPAVFPVGHSWQPQLKLLQCPMNRELVLSSSATAGALLFHGRELKSVGDGGFPTHRATFLFRFVGGLGSDPFPRWRQKLIFEIYPECNFVSEG